MKKNKTPYIRWTDMKKIFSEAIIAEHFKPNIVKPIKGQPPGVELWLYSCRKIIQTIQAKRLPVEIKPEFEAMRQEVLDFLKPTLADAEKGIYKQVEQGKTVKPLARSKPTLPRTQAKPAPTVIYKKPKRLLAA
jgi:hypothetical protein